MKKSEIFVKVQEVLRDSLGMEEGEEISLYTKLIEELGAESIDLLDILSRLERRFNIKIDSGEEVEASIRAMLSPEEMETGVLPPEVLKKLPQLMPEINPAAFKPGLKLNDLPMLFTVDTLIYSVEDAYKKMGIQVENDLH